MGRVPEQCFYCLGARASSPRTSMEEALHRSCRGEVGMQMSPGVLGQLLGAALQTVWQLHLSLGALPLK
ncbi:hypothetical protein [Chloroflexus sp. Y-396-1]|uniref:hypothetical protein n=1 Tax=Chloroflexus sp. Y-396-1 TaxID=867845 RepID=UPI00048D8A12|nr:hypothetical protein [Chloroflexus sp. Y-396-1]